MDLKYVLAIQEFEFLDTIFLLQILAIALASLLIIRLEDSTLAMKRFSFFLMSAIYGIILITLNIAFAQKFGTSNLGTTLCTIMSVLFSMTYAWILMKRVRDAGHEKSIAYLACIPIINIFIITYLCFAKSVPKQRRSNIRGWTLR